MRFSDRIGFLDASGFEESEHPRNKKGEFSKRPDGKAVQFNGNEVRIDARGNVLSGLEKQWEQTPNKVTAASSFKEIADSITCKSAARHALKTATRKCFGKHRAKLEDGSQIDVFVSNVAVEEANNKIGQGHVKTKVAIAEARRHVFALEHLDELLTAGEVIPGWSHSEIHHPEFDFKCFYKRFSYEGKKPIFAVDVSRLHEEAKGRKELYSVTNEMNAGFATKAQSYKFDMKGEDGEMPKFELFRVRCLLDHRQ